MRMPQFQLVANTTGKVGVVLSQVGTFGWLKNSVRFDGRFGDGRQFPTWEFSLVLVHLVRTTVQQFAWMSVHPEHGRPNSSSGMRRDENQTRPQDKTEKEGGPLLPLESCTLSNVRHDTGREVWNLQFPLVHRPEPPMQKEIDGGTSVNTWLQSSCKESTRVRHIAISIGALVISVPAQLLHGGRQILFDAVQWPWLPGIMMHVHDVQHVRQPRFWFLDEEECCSEEIGVVDVPHEGGQFVPEKSVQEFDEGRRAFECTFSTKTRLILTRNGELQNIFKNFENFIKRLDTTFFFCKSASNSELGDYCNNALGGQDGRCSARFRSHLQDELRRSYSKLQGRRCWG